MSSQIKQCQDRGKIVTLSVGGAISNIGFRTDSQATAFADIIWDKFLGGASLYRPFGDAILDGYAELFDFFPFRALMADIALFPFPVVVVVIYIQGST